MTSLTRRAAYYLLALVAATLLFAGGYSVGMSVWEGRPRPWYQSLQVVVQTFTTTGYGEDAPWQSLQMNLLVVLIQFAGIGFILSAVDVFVVPWLREALRPSAPTSLQDQSGHVIVCGYTPRVEVFRCSSRRWRSADRTMCSSSRIRAGLARCTRRDTARWRETPRRRTR